MQLSPSVREICREMGFRSSSTAHAHLEALQRKGYIRRDPTKPRAIEILVDFSPASKASSSAPSSAPPVNFAPLLGRITAGKPVLAEENYQGYLPLPPEFPRGADYFVLRVSGDSMKGAGILDRDYVIIRRQEAVENGEIAAVLLEDEATVKRFFKEGDLIRLQPENSLYKPILVRQVQVLGKVVGLFRKM